MKNIKILYITLITLATFVACDYEKASIDSAETGSLDGKPTISITSDTPNGMVAEGSSITFTINLDKPVKYGVGFHAVISGVAGEEDILW